MQALYNVSSYYLLEFLCKGFPRVALYLHMNVFICMIEFLDAVKSINFVHLKLHILIILIIF